MSDDERTGRRDLLYSQWHRVGHLAETRLLSRVEASKLLVVDIDWCESCPYCRQPLALIETKNSAGSPAQFSAAVTARLARAAGIRAFLVTYLCWCGVAGDQHATEPGCDIDRFQRQQIEPAESTVHQLTPQAYARWLLDLRSACTCLADQQPAA